DSCLLGPFGPLVATISGSGSDSTRSNSISGPVTINSDKGSYVGSRNRPTYASSGRDVSKVPPLSQHRRGSGNKRGLQSFLADLFVCEQFRSLDRTTTRRIDQQMPDSSTTSDGEEP